MEGKVEHLRSNNKVQYIERPNTERSIWETERNLVQYLDFRITDIRTVRFEIFFQ